MPETRIEQQLGDGSGGGRGPRPWGVVLAVIALLLVAFVGLGSRDALWNVGGPPKLIDSREYAGDLMIVGLALLLVLPYVIRALQRRRRPVQKPDPELAPARVSWWMKMLAYLTIPLAILVALLIISVLPRNPPHKKNGGALKPSTPAAKFPGSQDRRGPPVHWWGWVLLAAVVGGGVAVVWRMREQRPPPKLVDEPDELLAAVDISLDDLENEPDPRRAVIRAYARMERALGSYGFARHPSETPLEYLARALASLRVGRRSIERLSALFERAKFSQHEIDLTMKSDALAALGALRDELAGAAT